MWTLSFQQGWQARQPRRASCLHLTWPTLELKAGTTVLNFFVVAEGPDSGDHACSANTLPIGPSSQFLEENSSKSKTCWRSSPMYPCTRVPMHPCVPMHLCTCAPMCAMHLCIYALMYTCTYASVHQCTHAPMYPCTSASVHSCTHSPMLRSCITYTHECASCGEERWTENFS